MAYRFSFLYIIGFPAYSHHRPTIIMLKDECINCVSKLINMVLRNYINITDIKLDSLT